MAENDPNQQTQAPPRGGAWKPAEKTRGAPVRGDAGPAGEAAPKGRPSDDRARTEAAAAETERAPDPDTPVGGGEGRRSLGGSASEPPGKGGA